MDLSHFKCAIENLVKAVHQGKWAHLHKFTYILRPHHVLRIKNPGLIERTVPEEKKNFSIADSEGILLHITVPWKIRSNESEDSEKQVNDKNICFIIYFLSLFLFTFVLSQIILLYSHLQSTVFSLCYFVHSDPSFLHFC